MHTWLPDAHSEAPAPVSALMSGVLLNVGLYAVLRFRPVVDAAAGPHFSRGLLLGLGLGSMALAAAFLWAPRNYKRMLAYSSVEHTGLACLGLGFGGIWGTTGALLHMANHALAKSVLFLASGRIRAPSASPGTRALPTPWPTARRWRRWPAAPSRYAPRSCASWASSSSGCTTCFRLREELLRINERLCGHRLLRGMLVPGGLAAPIATETVRDAATAVDRVTAEFRDIATLCLENTLVLERLLGTGRLTTATARGMQVVGLVARASGIDADLRRDAPADGYLELGVRVATGDAGDVWARTMVRLAEVAESARLVAAVAARLEDGPTVAPLPPLPAREVAFGACEAWRDPSRTPSPPTPPAGSDA